MRRTRRLLIACFKYVQSLQARLPALRMHLPTWDIDVAYVQSWDHYRDDEGWVAFWCVKPEASIRSHKYTRHQCLCVWIPQNCHGISFMWLSHNRDAFVAEIQPGRPDAYDSVVSTRRQKSTRWDVSDAFHLYFMYVQCYRRLQSHVFTLVRLSTVVTESKLEAVREWPWKAHEMWSTAGRKALGEEHVSNPQTVVVPACCSWIIPYVNTLVRPEGC